MVSSISCPNYTLKYYFFYIILFVIIFSLGAYIITSYKNNHKEKIIAEKIKEETCDPITTEIDWCKNAKTVSLRGVGLLVDDNFKKFMKIRPGNHDYTGLSGIKIIKSKTNPNVKYARVFVIEKDFRLVPGTEKTLIMDGDFNAIEVVNGNLFKN